MIYATFVLGYDYDTPADIEATMKFAMDNHFAAANFNPLIPMPGTKLYQRLEEEGKLMYQSWWTKEDYKYGDSAYYPESMTPEELEEGCKKARYTFNTYKNIFKRLFGNRIYFNPVNACVFLLLNFISRKEIHRKQGKVLGK